MSNYRPIALGMTINVQF